MRFVPTIVSLIIALAAPTLCRGGLLVHPCDDEHSSSHNDGNHNEQDGGCGHEEGCAADPCSLVARIGSTSRISSSMDYGPGIEQADATLVAPIRISSDDFGPSYISWLITAVLAPPEQSRCLPLLI